MKTDHLTLGDLVAIFKKRFLPILLAALVLGVLGFLLRALLPTQYSASASFHVRSMQSQAYLEANGLTSSQLAVLQGQAKEYAALVSEADELLDRAISRHGLPCTREALRDMISATTDSTAFTVTLTHAEPAVAEAAAAAIAAELPGFLQERFFPAVRDRQCVAPLREATAAARSSASPFLWAGLFALGAALLVYCIYLFCFLFSNRLADGDEIARVLTEDTVLATVPYTLPPQDATEAFFALRERLPQGNGKRALCVSLLSAQPAEGATFVAKGLACSLAATGARVLLLDADLRQSGKEPFLLPEAEPGLAEYLSGRVKDAARLVHTNEKLSLDILPAGVLPTTPAAHAMRAKTKALLVALAPKYDYIIADFPAHRQAPEGAVLAGLFDATLLVAAPKRGGAKELRAMRAVLRDEGVAVAGAVVNHAPRVRHAHPV